jgi:hypothetical protein
LNFADPAQNLEKVTQFSKLGAGGGVGREAVFKLQPLFRGRFSVKDGIHQLNKFGLVHLSSFSGPSAVRPGVAWLRTAGI